jgi:hypothetical protein
MGASDGYQHDAPLFDHVRSTLLAQVLACNFSVMKVLGDRVLRPFLQDTIQVGTVLHCCTALLSY